MRTMIPGVLILILWSATPAFAQLPPEILADSYLLRVEQAIGEGDHNRARAEIDKINLLEKENELDLPDEFHFRYAKAAAAAGLPDDALDAVVKYLTAAGREGRHYVEALELMNKAQDAIEARKEPEVASTGEPASTQDPVEAELETGGTPEAQEVMRALIVAAESAEAQPAPQCDLEQWRAEVFFRTATVQDVKACLEAGADPIARNKYYITPLHWAARNNENPAVLEALLAAGADPKAWDWGESTPLHNAARYNKNPAVVRALLAAGTDPKARDWRKRTPLHEAARYNENPEVVQALLAAGADPNTKDMSRNTPLDEAEDAGNITAIEVLRHQKRATARRTRTKKRGGGLGAFIAGTALAATASAAGASTEDAVALGSSVITGQQPAGNSGVGFDPDVLGPTGSTGGTAGGGSCLIPGYPSPPGGVANLGLSWCPASIDFQARAFALQAAGAQCAIATGSSSTPEQIQARRREIGAACERLAALGVSNCRCPAGYGP